MRNSAGCLPWLRSWEADSTRRGGAGALRRLRFQRGDRLAPGFTRNGAGYRVARLLRKQSVPTRAAPPASFVSQTEILEVGRAVSGPDIAVNDLSALLSEWWGRSGEKA